MHIALGGCGIAFRPTWVVYIYFVPFVYLHSYLLARYRRSNPLSWFALVLGALLLLFQRLPDVETATLDSLVVVVSYFGSYAALHSHVWWIGQCVLVAGRVRVTSTARDFINVGDGFCPMLQPIYYSATWRYASYSLLNLWPISR